jgi:hypothetical protein
LVYSEYDLIEKISKIKQVNLFGDLD